MKPQRNRLPISGQGSLMIPDDRLMSVFSTLQLLRDGYPGRIHSSDVPQRGPRFDVIARWLDAFFTEFVEYASFKASFFLHDGPLPLPYPGDELFQRHWVKSTKANLLGHLRWVYPNRDLVLVRPVFDGTGHARERMYGQLGVDDAQYQINERVRKGKPGYSPTFFSQVVFQSSDPDLATTLEQAIHAELLQLVDLLLGVSADAMQFRPGAGKAGRRRLARRATDEIADRFGRSPFAFQRHQRRFSVSLYPDAHGRMYAANPERLDRPVDGTQLPLLSIGSGEPG